MKIKDILCRWKKESNLRSHTHQTMDVGDWLIRGYEFEDIIDPYLVTKVIKEPQSIVFWASKFGIEEPEKFDYDDIGIGSGIKQKDICEILQKELLM